MWLCYVSFNVINTYGVHFSGSWKPSKGTYFLGYTLHPIEIPSNTVFQRGESCPRLESFKPSLLPCIGNEQLFIPQLSLLYHYLHGTTTQPRHDTQQQSNNHRIVLCFSTNPSTFCIVIQNVHGTQLRSMKQPISNNRCVVLEGNLIACNSCSLAPSLSISRCLHLFSPSIFRSFYPSTSFHLSGCLIDSFHLSLTFKPFILPFQTFPAPTPHTHSSPYPFCHSPSLPGLLASPFFPGLWFILPSFALTTPQPPSHPCRVRFW